LVDKAEVQVRRHLNALPAAHPVRARAAAYLKRHAAVTLRTAPEGAEVRLHRYEERQRQLVPEFERTLGFTPLSEVTLAHGSYLLTRRLRGNDLIP